MALTLDEKIARAKVRAREKSKATTAAQRALKRAEKAADKAFNTVERLEWERECLRQEQADRAGKHGPILVLGGAEFILVVVEMLPLHSRGWRFRFRRVGDSVAHWGVDAERQDGGSWRFSQWSGPRGIDWEQEREKLIEALRHKDHHYALWAYNELLEVAEVP